MEWALSHLSPLYLSPWQSGPPCSSKHLQLSWYLPFASVQSAFFYQRCWIVGMKALCRHQLLGVVFNRALLSILATAWVISGFLWDPLSWLLECNCGLILECFSSFSGSEIELYMLYLGRYIKRDLGLWVKYSIFLSSNTMGRKYESLQGDHSDVLSKFIGVLPGRTRSDKFIFWISRKQKR